MNTLAFATIGHMVGDFVLQNDWLAAGKKRSTPICALHCLIWSLCVMAFAGWWVPWVFAVLFITHFAQDRTGFIRWWMGLMGQNDFALPPLGPWSIIVVDNTFHLAALAIVAIGVGL